MLDSAELELVVEIAGVMLSPSEPVVEVVRTGSTEGPWVGAPEKVGSGWGVANICPSGPRIRRAESCTSATHLVNPALEITDSLGSRRMFGKLTSFFVGK